jgi:hypothetical protein
VTVPWIDTVPVLDNFSEVVDPARYAPVPDNWQIAVSDIVNSTKEIEQGRYKAVNVVGAAVICAVSNALEGDLPLFVFGGDGARLVVPPSKSERVAKALSRVAMWAARDMKLNLRVGMTSAADIRSAGHEVLVTFWQPSEHVRYAMFSGGGLEFAEALLKSGEIGLPPSEMNEEPDLSGLSCQWGSVQPQHGKIVSLIVKPAELPPKAEFSKVASELMGVVEESAAPNPVPSNGPDVKWPAGSFALQSRIAHKGLPVSARYAYTLITASLSWLLFKTGIGFGGFDPARYRREVALNADFRKFDDGLVMTLDCSADTIEKIREILDTAVRDKILRYGIHVQDQALLTCVAPNVSTSSHMHFVDGAGGGYVAAARHLRESSLQRDSHQIA